MKQRKTIICFIIVTLLSSCGFISCSNYSVNNLNNNSDEKITTYTSTLDSEITNFSSNDKTSYTRSIVLYQEFSIDKEYRTAFEKSGKSNVEFINITSEYANKWGIMVDKYYNYLYQHLDATGKILLEKSRLEWESMTGIDADFLQYITNNNLISSSSSSTALAYEEYNHYRAKTIELMLYCQSLGFQNDDEYKSTFSDFFNISI
ncbi:MAG: hypothetical protein QM689_02720 [Oscillospiraceae bacterium]